MRKLPRLRAAIGLASLLWLTSCSRTFVVIPTGNLASSVRFMFYEARGDSETTAFNIVRLVVQEQLPGEDWTVAWMLGGEERLSSIEYGVPRGLEEIQPARPMRQSARYRILANELEWPYPQGSSLAVFSFDDRGQVVVEPTVVANE